MFTGIVTDIGTIIRIEPNQDTRFFISTRYDTETIAYGASIACEGVCLTVVEKGKTAEGGWFAVDVSAETFSCTTLGMMQEGRKINLERSLRLGDELGGHLVLGHVDGVGKVLSIRPEGDSHRVVFETPQTLSPFIAEKGSVTINGVSLTVNQVEGLRFGVNIIPHTWERTTFHALKEEEGVNMEIDMFARYIARITTAGYNAINI